jgi:hypothetical protein
MQRLLLSIIAAALVLGGAALYYSDVTGYAATAAVLLRSGLVLGALALALPQVRRLLEVAPPWFLASLGGGLLVVIRWPKAIGIVLPALALLWFLGPRSRSAPPARKAKAKPFKTRQRKA